MQNKGHNGDGEQSLCPWLKHRETASIGESKMELKVTDGWSEVDPRETPFTILADGQNLSLLSSSFEQCAEIGCVGGLNCPIAVDDAAKRAYWAISEQAPEDVRITREYLENRSADIVSFNLVSHTSSVVITLRKSVSCFWLLQYLACSNALLMLLTDTSQSGSVTSLGWLSLDAGELHTRPLVNQAFYPAAVDPAGQRILFSGRQGGAVLVDFNGQQIGETGVNHFYNLWGASFGPDEGIIVLGGNGIWAWKIHASEMVRLVPTGRHPVHSPDGVLWFNSSDGGVAYYDRDLDEAKTVVELLGLDLHDTNYGQPIVFSPDGRFGLARLCGKEILTGKALEVAEASVRLLNREVMDFDRYVYHHWHCVLDVVEKVVWKHPGYAHNVSWVTGQYYN